MSKYVCLVCGYIYDEQRGSPETGVVAGTKWDDVRDDWECPVCGAAKDEFAQVKEKNDSVVKDENIGSADVGEQKMSYGALSALFSNLAKGCEKQYKPEESELYMKLADFYKSVGGKVKKDTAGIAAAVKDDIGKYTAANETAEDTHDRGAMRALKWGEKVTRMLSSALAKYDKQKEKLLQDADIHVCEICGYVYIGQEPPEVCPVCKVPRAKIGRIAKEAV